MKKIILIIVAFLVFGCGEKDTDKNNKSLPKATVSRAANTSSFKTESQTQKRQIEKTTSCSANQIVSNANLFRESIKPKKSKLMEGIYIPKLTMKQAKYLLKHGTSQWFNIASKVSIKCRNFEAGNYFLENVYEVWNKKKWSAPIGSEWGNFLMRHGKGEEAIQVFNMAINDSVNNNELPCTIAQLYIDRTSVYNMMRKYKESLESARESFEYISKNKEKKGMKYKYIYGMYLYLQELCNNEEYDKALKVYNENKINLETPEGRSWNLKATILDDIKANRKSKFTLSQGYGILSK